jgi:hypothetical protein
MPLLGERPGRRDDVVPAWSHSSESIDDEVPGIQGNASRPIGGYRKKVGLPGFSLWLLGQAMGAG